MKARLLKRKRTVVHHNYSLATGRNRRSLPVRRRVKPGWYRLSLQIVAGRDTKYLTKRLKLRR
jgi:hypothetical protein